MSWNDYIKGHVRKTAERRRRLYGIKLPPVVAGLLSPDKAVLTFRESCRLIVYILFKSPRRRLKLLWRNLIDLDTPVRRQQIDLLAKDLRRRLSPGSRVAANFFERRNYSRDLARVPPMMETLLYRTTPSLVVQPEGEQDIIQTLAFCREKNLAVFPRGSSSFAFGGAVPTRNGILMDFSPMMDVLEVIPEKRAVRVQPGVRWADLASALESHGLVPVTTPTSRFSTVAGWISTGGMGLDSYGYGSVYDAVLGVRVARPDGRIEELEAGCEAIRDLFGTEGQFGILTEVTLRVRPKPDYTGARLFTFSSPDAALDFMRRIPACSGQPSHVVFFDRESMVRENLLFKDEFGLEDPVVPEKDVVLLHFETRQDEETFISSLNGDSRQAEENTVAARYLWSDRYFPLKAQRIGPGLLGSEVVVPRAHVPVYIGRVRRLARHFCIKPAVEVIVGREGDSCTNLVIVSFPCDNSRSVHYVLRLLFIQLLVRMAVRLGGRPYGIGIWNTPFVKSKYGKEGLDRLRRRKIEIDPRSSLNPNKFFRIKGRFLSIPAFPLRPHVFSAVLDLFLLASPVLQPLARMVEPESLSGWDVPGKQDQQGISLLRQCAQRCTLCGSCVSACPAYHVTKDELVAGRTKLRMAEVMMNGRELKKEEAHAPFQCLHCGLCEEVCQTHLPLRECYLVLEDWIENRFGPPSETVKMFIEKLDGSREFLKNVFGLDLPEWSPEEDLSRVPAVEPEAEGGGA